jgi:hypothetical protein
VLSQFPKSASGNGQWFVGEHVDHATPRNLDFCPDTIEQ